MSTLLFEDRIEPGATWSHVLKRGTALRLTDVEGGANVGALFYNWENPVERYNMPDTLKAQHIARLTSGEVVEPVAPARRDTGRIRPGCDQTLEGPCGALRVPAPAAVSALGAAQVRDPARAGVAAPDQGQRLDRRAGAVRGAEGARLVSPAAVAVLRRAQPGGRAVELRRRDAGPAQREHRSLDLAGIAQRAREVNNDHSHHDQAQANVHREFVPKGYCSQFESCALQSA